jgi:hypothetical protein
MCLWRKRVQAIAKETLGIGWRRHSELGPNLLMDNEANFAILMRVDFKSEVGGF